MMRAFFRRIRPLAGHIAALLLEKRCPACGTPVSPSAGAAKNGPASDLCPACALALARRAGGYCDRCGAVSAWPDAPPAPCGKCLAATRPWGRFFLHGAYAGLLRDLLLRFKHKHELPLGPLLGSLLAAHPGLEGDTYDALVPLPLHPKRLRERGFNQSLELARPLALRLAAPVAPDFLRRTAHTAPQTSLHYNDRHSNVRGIFAADAAVRDKRILLIDDVATTGATLEEAAKTLLAAGAANVDAAVIARTPDHAAL